MNRLSVILGALALTATVMLLPRSTTEHVHADHVNEPKTPLEFVRFRMNHYPDPPIFMAYQFVGEEPVYDVSPADDGIVPCDGTGPGHPRDVSLRMWTNVAIGEDANAPSEHWNQKITISYGGSGGASGILAIQRWDHANINPHGRRASLNPTLDVWNQGWESSEGSVILRNLPDTVYRLNVRVELVGLESGNRFDFTCRVPIVDEVEITS